jgi:hypothetical protein
MASKKITELPAATTPILPGVKFEAVQGGVNVQVDADDMPGAAAGVTSISPTINRITVDNTNPAVPVIDIDAAYDAAVQAFANAKVADAINDGTTTVAPSQNAVFDALALKAPLASPTFTGTPAAPTAAPGTNNTQLATTAYVDAATTAALSAAKSMVISVTDEVTNIGTGTGKVSFRMPYAMTLTAVRASLVVAQASGSIFTVDINENGASILSTKLTIDNTETTSVTAVTPPVISDTALADDSVITVDVDQIGNGSAIGLKITLIGT